MKRLMKWFEAPLVVLVFLAGAAFLLKMCYLSLTLNTVFGIGFLGLFYGYLRMRHNIAVPVLLPLLVFVALQVDALGNYFRLYGAQFGPVQYDEFSHLMVQVLLTPIIVWLARHGLERRGHRLSVGLVSFFASTTIFSLAAFYEIIELWDEVYFAGQRIWSSHDTANDLQWDLLGIIFGALLANVLLRRDIASSRAAT